MKKTRRGCIFEFGPAGDVSRAGSVNNTKGYDGKRKGFPSYLAVLQYIYHWPICIRAKLLPITTKCFPDGKKTTWFLRSPRPLTPRLASFRSKSLIDSIFSLSLPSFEIWKEHISLKIYIDARASGRQTGSQLEKQDGVVDFSEYITLYWKIWQGAVTYTYAVHAPAADRITYIHDWYQCTNMKNWIV